MFGGAPAASTKDRLPWWFVTAIRLFLLVEGLGLWAVFIADTIRYPHLFYYGFPEVMWPVPPLLLGIPAVVLAFRPGAWDRGWHTPVFLVLNTPGAIGIGVLAVLPAYPVWYYAVIAAVTAGATLVLFLGVIRVRATVAASAIGAAVILVGYAATYALPPAVAPALALHFQGVLIIPSSAMDTLTPKPTGPYGFDHVDEHETAWMAAVVNPGNYGYAQACNGDSNHPTWSTVQVPWGAVGRARDLCPPPGMVSGFAIWTPCQPDRPAPGLDCRSRPLARHPLSFQSTAFGVAKGVMTDTAGTYTILLAPGSYTVSSDLGYVLISGQHEVTVESGGTAHLDLAFRFH
jgi:hypothetical protein